MEEKRESGFFLGFILTFFFSIGSWLCSIPAWATLILHYVIGLPIGWFFATLALWILAGIVRWGAILLARRAASGEEPVKENKNPYSYKNK